MDNLFYREKSIRLAGWDYGSPGSYFITICTKEKEHFFGEIENSRMNLNETGIISQNCWLGIPDHYVNVSLGAFVIMPNHIHGILTINKRIGPRAIFIDEYSGSDPVQENIDLSLHHDDVVGSGHALIHSQSKRHFRFR